MKKLFIVSLIFSLLPICIFSQRSKRLKGPTIKVSTTLNYYPTIEPYDFFSSFKANNDDILLTFLTANSGTFVIEENESLLINKVTNSQIPSQILGIGASVQIIKANALFHEVSLTKFSFAKSTHINEYSFIDRTGKNNRIRTGYKQNASAFGFRYEFGKYFGKRKAANFRFGLSGGIESSFYFYKRTSYSVDEYPMRASVFTVEVSVIPNVSTKISKKISLDFKVIPNILLGDYGSNVEKNPTVPISQQEGSREYNLPEINVAFSLLLRYNIKEPKKRRGS